jgi:hypothetical protein
MLNVGVGEPVHVPATAVTVPLDDGALGEATPFVIVMDGAIVFAGTVPTTVDVVKRGVVGDPLTAVTLTTKCLASSASFGV